MIVDHNRDVWPSDNNNKKSNNKLWILIRIARWDDKSYYQYVYWITLAKGSMNFA